MKRENVKIMTKDGTVQKWETAQEGRSGVRLETAFYEVGVSKKNGFFLEEKANDLLQADKIYGKLPSFCKRAYECFLEGEGNLGILFSGPAGNGKTLAASVLARECLRNGIPVVKAEAYHPGIGEFLMLFENTVMFWFEDFDLNFVQIQPAAGRVSPQTELLKLFDTKGREKKLFVVTCREIVAMEDTLLNRPERVRYHFYLDNPTVAAAKEYFKEQIGNAPVPEEEREKALRFLEKARVNYDCLKALAQEMKKGCTFAETAQILNLVPPRQERFDFKLYFQNGEFLEAKRRLFDIFGKEEKRIRLSEEEGLSEYSVCFFPGDCTYEEETDRLTFAPDKIRMICETKKGRNGNERIPALLVCRRTPPKEVHYTRAEENDR